MLAAAMALAGCEQLPRGAAVEREIVAVAQGEIADFAVYPVDRALLAQLADWPQTGERRLNWIPASGGARTQVIAPGDVLEITIWDSNENSLLSSNGQRQVQIQALTVAPDGSVFVPYVGNTQVSGLTLQLAREHLQDEIDMVVPSAQVQLTLVEGRTNSVDLVGGVSAPGAYPLPDRNYTVLNLLAAGGGVQAGLANPQIRLRRGGNIYGTSVERLYDNPGLDTLLIGGDQVIVEEDRRRFLSLGAAGQQNQHAFTQDTVTALDAMAIIGGVDSRRGNPGGILILREYPTSAVRTDGRGPTQSRVVFTLDLISADGLFSARNFHLHGDDLVLVTESPITSAQTIFGLIGSVFGLANQTSNLAD
ncbi:polysaccharide biosynthesis/export family protein [Roseicyclus mahoneyensis]|uniref:Polysaccharide export outer membrane protein n=1 Tax=Roseicyclus mahoneyensis TaxID=164332 RepID=A0A316GXU0_9RHOB|nr:polysaccharide biosynthesis/export family protein [Roseicyclus mahoneyensis]PWK59913.1 polysaccharide export outer membrane protein [Roseicyclus mahoneyensis]